MTTPPPPAQGNVEDFDFVSAVLHSHITLWGQLAGKNMTVFPAVCYYTALPWLPMSIKHQHFLRTMETMLKLNHSTFARLFPPCPGAWMKQWLQMYILWYTSHENLVFSHPPPTPPPPQKKKKYWPQTQNMTTADLFCNLFPSTFPPHH